MPKASMTIGVDVGGGTTRVALVRHDATILARFAGPTPQGGHGPELVRLIDMAARALRDYTGPAFQGAEIDNVVGVALPGIFDPEQGAIRRAVNLPALEGFPIRSTLEERLRYPVFIDTDVIAAGWAQRRALDQSPGASTAENRVARFIYLSIGTGIGACVVADGRIVRHTRGGGGHLGHLVVDTTATAPRCRCGASGCLEACVCERLRVSPNQRAAAWRTEVVAALALGLLQTCHIYAPTTIALGGGGIEHHPELIDDARREFARIRSTLVPETLQIVRAPLRSDDAGVIGAALLANAALARH